MKGAKSVPYAIDTAWKHAVRVRLAEMDWSASDLARKVGTTPQAISYVLGRAATSSLIPAIHDALGWDRPALVTPVRHETTDADAQGPADANEGFPAASPLVEQLLALFADLSDLNKGRVLGFAEGLRVLQPGSEPR